MKGVILVNKIISKIPPFPRYISDRIGERLLRLLSNVERRANAEHIPDFESKEDNIHETFLEVFSYHFRWPVAFVIIITTIFLFDWWLGPTKAPINLQIYGLVFDGYGAISIAFGLFRGKVGLARDTSETGARIGRATLHPDELRANAANTIDGVFGALFLLAGFTLQVISLLI